MSQVFIAMIRGWIFSCTLLAALVPTSYAHNGHADAIEEIVVYGRAEEQIGRAVSASEGLVGYDDIRLAPLLRVGELVEAVPGMVATQHSGTGKSNQYFLRGFNLDHGTDFSAFAEGVPLNMRTHAHGQGYLDLNFLIPELVATTAYRKGPYAVGVGDFSSAGTVEFGFHDELDDTSVTVTVGSADYLRGLLAGTARIGDGALTAAMATTRYSGPWDLDEDLQQDKIYLSHVGAVRGARSKATLQLYDASWTSTDQVPQRAITSGIVDRFGFLDPDLGGQSRRIALTGTLEWTNLEAGAYVVDSDFELYSNFTYFLEDAENGDEFEQTDVRRVFGAWTRGAVDTVLAGRDATFNWGADLRVDDIEEVGLFPTAARSRLGIARDDRVDQSSAGLYGELALNVSSRLRTQFGLRGDFIAWDVDAFRAANGGSGNDGILTPKVSAAYRFNDALEGYANWGRGFHSNDVRGITITTDPRTGEEVTAVDPLVGSTGGEVGLRIERGSRFNATAAFFWLELDSELVFVGDAGTTEPNDGSKRSGLEVTAFWQLTDWLAVNAQYAKTDAEYQIASLANEVPGAIDDMLSLGANAVWRNGLSASARLRYLGDAALVEDGSVRSQASTLVNAGVTYRTGKVELRLDAFNLLDSDEADISYFYSSRLPGEPGDGVGDVHFHPLEPLSVRASVTYYLN